MVSHWEAFLPAWARTNKRDGERSPGSGDPRLRRAVREVWLLERRVAYGRPGIWWRMLVLPSDSALDFESCAKLENEGPLTQCQWRRQPAGLPVATCRGDSPRRRHASGGDNPTLGEGRGRYSDNEGLAGHFRHRGAINTSEPSTHPNR